MPGDTRAAYEHTNEARQVLNDAEDDLKDWTPELEDVTHHGSALENNLMPTTATQSEAGTAVTTDATVAPTHHDVTSSSGASVTTGGLAESEAGLIRE